MNRNKIPSKIYLEKLNSRIHVFGILFAIIFIPFLTKWTLLRDNGQLTCAVILYEFCFLCVFTFSTLYHSTHNKSQKHIFEILDHISIYFLIAGTYTPYLIKYLNNPEGVHLPYVIWSLALLGCLFKIFYVDRFDYFSIAVYLFMGLMYIWLGKSFFAPMPSLVIKMIRRQCAIYY